MRHFAAIAWEAKLDAAINELDRYFEQKYGGRYLLHPARPGKGKTANPSHDGLFSITASFTLGLGSEIGKGYVVDIRLVTLEKVPPHVREEVRGEALVRLKALLPLYFPETVLSVTLDGPVIKIYGDLSLGTV